MTTAGQDGVFISWFLILTVNVFLEDKKHMCVCVYVQVVMHKHLLHVTIECFFFPIFIFSSASSHLKPNTSAYLSRVYCTV